MSNKTSGRWTPGQSGNPAGKRPGASSVQALRHEIQQLIPGIVERLAQKALEGDVAAARLLLEWAIPPLRAVEVGHSFECPAGSPADQARAIIAQGAAGALSVGQLSQLVTTLSALSHLTMTEEVEQRLAALESSIASQVSP